MSDLALQSARVTTHQNVLFLCTHNSARSILAEGLLNHWGQGRCRGFSAGSQPSGRVNPHALSTLQSLGIAVSGLRSKSWDEFAGTDAQRMDIIITVCENAADEPCPVWLGRPMQAHWGCADPSTTLGDDTAIAAAFLRTAELLGQRIRALIALLSADADLEYTRARVNAIAASTPLA